MQKTPAATVGNEQLKQAFVCHERVVSYTVFFFFDCSAGIGRTGCFIATSIALQQLRRENVVDILGIVCAMRLDRLEAAAAAAVK
jgi:protein tyrosine phosphatase